jgi:chromosome segregation ATPase
MSSGSGERGSEGPAERVEAAERRLREAAESAAAAEERATAEIRALEENLEKERQRSAEELEGLRRSYEAKLATEREARRQAIAAADSRLAEIEAQAEAAEERIGEAQRQATAAEQAQGGGSRARESAAAWLREQVAAIRREAGRQ